VAPARRNILIQEQSLAAIEALLETCGVEAFQPSESAAIQAYPIKDRTVFVMKCRHGFVRIERGKSVINMGISF